MQVANQTHNIQNLSIGMMGQNRVKSSFVIKNNQLIGKHRSPHYSNIYDPFVQESTVDPRSFGMGKNFVNLYRVHVGQKPNNKIYALKVIDFSRIGNQNVGAAQRIIQMEKYYLQKVKSDRCVKYFGIQIANDHMKIYLQYCAGWDNCRTLADYIKVKNQRYMFPKDQLEWQYRNLEIQIQIMMALRDLIQNNIIHKDIKPQNILFKQDGSIRLADFDNIQIFFRQSFQACGTPIYKPIELQLAQNKNQLCPLKIDIWSLGVVCHQLHQKRRGQNRLPYNMHELRLMLQYENVNDISIYEKIKDNQVEYVSVKVSDPRLSQLPVLIGKMLAIRNECRISFKQIYSSNQFVQLIQYVIQLHEQNLILRFLNKTQILQMFSYKSLYQQVQIKGSQIVKDQLLYRDLYNGYFYSGEGRQQIQTLSQLLKNLYQVEHNPNKDKRKVVIRLYRVMSKLVQLYQKGNLKYFISQPYDASFKLIQRLMPELRYRFRATFARKLEDIVISTQSQDEYLLRTYQ